MPPIPIAAARKALSSALYLAFCLATLGHFVTGAPADLRPIGAALLVLFLAALCLQGPALASPALPAIGGFVAAQPAEKSARAVVIDNTGTSVSAERPNQIRATQTTPPAFFAQPRRDWGIWVSFELTGHASRRAEGSGD
jgi:hypothetical protein